MCDELEEEGKNREERGKGKNMASSIAGGRRVYIGRPLVPVRGTNRDWDLSLRMTERYLWAHSVMHHHNELNVTK